MNTSFNSLDTTLNGMYLDDASQLSTMTPIVTPPNMNENQALNQPSNILQPMQDFQQVIDPRETATMNERSFFYSPCNDTQIYHINCKEVSF
jgi:hypothetical protein